MLVWNVLCWNFPFFWDNILNAKIALWAMGTNFSQLVVPESLDAGHPPFFSFYLGLGLKLSRSLVMAHLLMLPFLWMIVWQWWKLCRRFLSPAAAPWGMLILFAEPTFLAQSSMMSPDVALVAFFLLGMNAVMENRKGWLMFATIGMAMVTFRGILMVPSLWLIGLWWKQPGWKLTALWRQTWAYLPVAVVTVLWLGYHWQVQGWLFTPPEETYGGHREAVGLGGILYNLGIAGWRFLDYGRVFVWIFLGVALVLRGKFLLAHQRFRGLWPLLAVATGWLVLLLLPFSNPIGHRYFAAQFLLLALLVFVAIDLLETAWRRWLVPLSLGIGLVGGHFWVYPDTIAQGWDASLAHVRYFDLRLQAEQELAGTYGICSAFPLAADARTFYLWDLPGLELDRKDDEVMESCSKILQSNVSNGFSDAELGRLQRGEGWKLEREWRNGPVYLRLYTQPAP